MAVVTAMELLGHRTMEAEEDPAAPLLALFNFYWFGGPIIPPPSPPPTPSPPPESCISEPALITHLELPPPSRPGRHRRSFSDEIIPPPASSTLPLPKLRTILSGKEGDVNVEIPIISPSDGKAGRRRRWRRRRRSTGSESRSMTDLEFEELKGFMDLGFDFTNVEPTPRLMSIVPGLQRLRAAVGGEEAAAVSSPSGSDGGSEESVVVRPYLSEAWEAAERRQLMKWKIPAASEGIDLKDHLRAWAQTVASTVR